MIVASLAGMKFSLLESEESFFESEQSFQMIVNF